MAYKLFNLIAAAIMVFFAVPKLTGAARSVAGFVQFEEVLGLNADLFRVFTGVTEIGIAVLLVFISIRQFNKLGFLAYTVLSFTMIVGLGMEFFVRPEPKMLLVSIAILLLTLSLYRLNQLKKTISF